MILAGLSTKHRYLLLLLNNLLLQKTTFTFTHHVRQFPVIDLSWLRFIVANRYNLLSAAEHNLQRRFDIVHGLVADDKVVQILDDLRNEMISEEDALARLRAAPFQTVQYSFHTERAVAYLNRLEVVNV